MNFLINILLKKYKPKLIVVFGAHGRQESSAAIHAVLSGHTKVFSVSADSFYKEFSKKTGGVVSVLSALFFQTDVPNVIILSADPNNSKYKKLKEILGIDIAVAMPTDDVPSFADMFAGSGSLARKILREIRTARRAVMCGDDEALSDISTELTRRAVKFGFYEINDIKVENVNSEISIKRKAYGKTNIKIAYYGKFVPFSIYSGFGKRNIYAAAAALGVSLFYDINFINAAQDLKKYKPFQNSFGLITGIKSTAIISAIKDTTPYSAREAVELLGKFRENGDISSSVMVLGDIITGKDGEFEGLHRYLGELAAHNADMLILIGGRVIFTEEEAQKHGMDSQNIFRFNTAAEAAAKTQEILKRGDGVLILGSEEAGLKRVIDEIRAR